MVIALLRTVVIAVSLACVSAAFGADESAPVQKPEVKVGERWAYRRTDDPTKQPKVTTYEDSVAFVGTDEILTVNKSGTSESQWNSEWGAMSLGGSGMVFDKPVGILKFPLMVGAIHETVYSVVARRGSDMRSKNEAKVKVVAWEDVVVPAGKFRALKIEAIGTYTRLDIRHGGWMRQTFWYAPEVKRWVKIVYEDGFRDPSTPYTHVVHELTSFTAN